MCSRKNFASSPISLSPQPCATAAESAVSTPVDSGMAVPDSAPVATADNVFPQGLQIERDVVWLAGE